VHGSERAADRTANSGDDGAFTVAGLEPGKYELKASKDGFASPPTKTLVLAANESFNANIDFQQPLPAGATPTPAAAAPPAPPAGFIRRFIKAYADDW
jgi:hypothetical protein